MPGVGSSGFGSSPYGLGLVHTDDPDSSILRDAATGLTTGSRRIDPAKKDYVIDKYGRTEGMPDVQQLVLLAVSTEKGSAALRELGHELAKIRTITSDFEVRARSTLENAVRHLVVLGLIEVVDVVVATTPGTGRAAISLRWRDLTADPRFADQTTPVR